MSAFNKEDVLSEMEDLIEKMSRKEQQEFSNQLRRIKEKVQKLLEQVEI